MRCHRPHALSGLASSASTVCPPPNYCAANIYVAFAVHKAEGHFSIVLLYEAAACRHLTVGNRQLEAQKSFEHASRASCAQRSFVATSHLLIGFYEHVTARASLRDDQQRRTHPADCPSKRLESVEIGEIRPSPPGTCTRSGSSPASKHRASGTSVELTTTCVGEYSVCKA